MAVASDEPCSLARKENMMKKVSMYTLSTCPSCKKTMKFFKRHHIPFEFTNYDLADERYQMNLCGGILAHDPLGGARFS
jgi:hypothetical protein